MDYVKLCMNPTSVPTDVGQNCAFYGGTFGWQELGAATGGSSFWEVLTIPEAMTIIELALLSFVIAYTFRLLAKHLNPQN